MPRALITGGAGFIGSHLSEHLLDAGWDVSVVDDLSTGSRRNIAHLEASEHFSWNEASVLERSLMKQLIEASDMVFHLAAAVGVKLAMEHPVHALETNLLTSQLVLSLCAEAGKPILLTSSSEAYGQLSHSELRETDNRLIGPFPEVRWGYAASKIACECLAAAYAVERGLAVITVRLFNVIGPRQTGQYGMVVPRFVRQALGGQPLTVYGDGTQTRSFTWVGDAVQIMTRLAQMTGAYGRVLNVGSDQEISILDLAHKIRSLCDSSSEIHMVPIDDLYEGRFRDIERRRPDLSEINRLIDYRPTLELDEMLRRIIRHAAGDDFPQKLNR